MGARDWDDRGLLSRPLRLAARLRDADEAELEHLFREARVLVRLEDAFAAVPDARETFFFAVNQVLRFCPNVAIYVPEDARDLLDAGDDLAARVHGLGHQVQIAGAGDAAAFNAVVNIGTNVVAGLPWVTVNSTGWVARVAAADSGTDRLPWTAGVPNAIGALGAACLGAGRAFLYVVGKALTMPLREISLFTNEVAVAGTLPPGPELPSEPVELDAFLVGCGAVANGWAYAVKRLPIIGRLDAIDRQALRIENIAPYVASGREWLRKPKAEMMKALLAPAIEVMPRPEEWELFKIRFRYGVAVPPVVVNGLDNVETRHSVQRLWPEVLVDMAADGLTNQVIVKARESDRICLLHALDRPAREIGWAERAACETGLPIGRILTEPTTAITESDVAAAAEDKRPALERDRASGQLICGRLTEHNLLFERPNPNFTPAVPFVTGFSGVVGAAATMRWLMGYREEADLHFQHSFASGRARTLAMTCDPGCDCRAQAGRRTSWTS
jgi:hypothetical protein